MKTQATMPMTGTVCAFLLLFTTFAKTRMLSKRSTGLSDY
jgi:hypothetical protein